MRLLAPAKINLHLRVGPKNVGALANDGFHPLLTWMVTVGLFDTLTFEIASPAMGVPAGAGVIALRCNQPDLPTDSANLVVRVGEALADTLGRDGEGPVGGRERVSAFLEKRVPAGAGLGGGSSDAAATLRGLCALWKLRWSNRQLADFAARFGADIPFFFYGPSSVCTGKGEVVRPTPPPSVKWVTLVLPNLHVATADVYRRFDEMQLGRAETVNDPPDWRAWAKLPADDLLMRLVNDLEEPAFSLRPELAVLRNDLRRELNKVVRMSGSGSSLFTLFDDPSQAQESAARVERRFGVHAGAYEIAPQIVESEVPR